MNIDDELRRLFADERLELAVRPGAEQRIVAGARRIRRRRYAAVTAAAVVAVLAVGSGIALAGTGGQESLPPAVSTTDPVPTTSATSPPATTSTRPSPPAAKNTTPPSVPDRKVDETAEPPPTQEKPNLPVIGPDSFGSLTLGMSADAALATGLLGQAEADDGACIRYAGTFGGNVLVSAKLGLVRIGVTSPVATPAGIRLGSTVAEVRAAYPNAWDYRMGLKAGNFGFIVGGPNGAYDPWPETSQVVRIDIAIESDCALAL